MKLAIVGGGWAGMAAAVQAAQLGWDTTVFEATQHLGGRARALAAQRPDGVPLTLDNGQHILIGAYSHTLALMQHVGMRPERALLALPLGLPYPDGSGLQTPRWASRWRAPLHVLAAIACAKGWSWAERWALMRAAAGWQRDAFTCPESMNVGQLCAPLPARVMADLIEPLCVSALNQPCTQASARVFLRVMQDALWGPGFGAWSASTLLLPRTDLSTLLPSAAAQWLRTHHPHHARVRLGARVLGLQSQTKGRWALHGHGWLEHVDRVIWATAAGPAAQAMHQTAEQIDTPKPLRESLKQWAQTTGALSHSAITTVYAWAPGVRLPCPMLALRTKAEHHPAQFVFDRGQISASEQPSLEGVLAFVVSASKGTRQALETQVLQQATEQLGLPQLRAVTTVVEKRATFACTPGMQRPTAQIAPHLWAAGDYVDNPYQGPYPATLESAVRSGLFAVSKI